MIKNTNINLALYTAITNPCTSEIITAINSRYKNREIVGIAFSDRWRSSWSDILVDRTPIATLISCPL